MSSYKWRRIPCEQCGQTFEAKRRDARYCSPKCRKAASRGAAPDVMARLTHEGRRRVLLEIQQSATSGNAESVQTAPTLRNGKQLDREAARANVRYFDSRWEAARRAFAEAAPGTEAHAQTEQAMKDAYAMLSAARINERALFPPPKDAEAARALIKADELREFIREDFKTAREAAKAAREALEHIHKAPAMAVRKIAAAEAEAYAMRAEGRAAAARAYMVDIEALEKIDDIHNRAPGFTRCCIEARNLYTHLERAVQDARAAVDKAAAAAANAEAAEAASVDEKGIQDKAASAGKDTEAPAASEAVTDTVAQGMEVTEKPAPPGGEAPEKPAARYRCRHCDKPLSGNWLYCSNDCRKAAKGAPATDIDAARAWIETAPRVREVETEAEAAAWGRESLKSALYQARNWAQKAHETAEQVNGPRPLLVLTGLGVNVRAWSDMVERAAAPIFEAAATAQRDEELQRLAAEARAAVDKAAAAAANVEAAEAASVDEKGIQDKAASAGKDTEAPAASEAVTDTVARVMEVTDKEIETMQAQIKELESRIEYLEGLLQVESRIDRIISAKADRTANSNAPFWRCRLLSGETVNVFAPNSKGEGNLNLFDAAARDSFESIPYLEEMDVSGELYVVVEKLPWARYWNLRAVVAPAAMDAAAEAPVLYANGAAAEASLAAQAARAALERARDARDTQSDIDVVQAAKAARIAEAEAEAAADAAQAAQDAAEAARVAQAAAARVLRTHPGNAEAQAAAVAALEELRAADKAAEAAAAIAADAVVIAEDAARLVNRLAVSEGDSVGHETEAAEGGA